MSEKYHVNFQVCPLFNAGESTVYCFKGKIAFDSTTKHEVEKGDINVHELPSCGWFVITPKAKGCAVPLIAQNLPGLNVR